MSQSETDQPQKEKLPHSGFGILSLAFALLAIGAICLTIVFAEYEERLGEFIPHNWGQGGDPDPLLPTVALIAALLMLSSIPLAILACAFGTTGVCQPHTRKVFAIWGLILSTVPVIFFAFVFIGARAGW